MRVVNGTEFAARADVVVVAAHDDLDLRGAHTAPCRRSCGAPS